MKVTLQLDAPHATERLPLELTNDSFDVPGWMSIVIDGEHVGDIHIDEILPALIAFDAHRSRSDNNHD